MKGYSIETNTWQEIVSEKQLMTFANSSSTEQAIKNLKRNGFKVEQIDLHYKTEIYK